MADSKLGKTLDDLYKELVPKEAREAVVTSLQAWLLNKAYRLIVKLGGGKK